jgi:hypothetical protein
MSDNIPLTPSASIVSEPIVTSTASPIITSTAASTVTTSASPSPVLTTTSLSVAEINVAAATSEPKVLNVYGKKELIFTLIPIIIEVIFVIYLFVAKKKFSNEAMLLFFLLVLIFCITGAVLLLKKYKDVQKMDKTNIKIKGNNTLLGVGILLAILALVLQFVNVGIGKYFENKRY